MGLAPYMIDVQYYRPEVPEKCQWLKGRLDRPTEYAKVQQFPSQRAVRIKVYGTGVGFRLPADKMDREGGYVYAGDDAYALWQDDDYLYVAVINPEGDTRNIALETHRRNLSHPDCGKRTRVFLPLAMLERMIPETAIRFVGIQIEEPDATLLGFG